MEQQVVKCICDNSTGIDVWVTIIISFLNLIFVVWFYFNDKKQKKKESEKSYKMTWYRTFDFKENMDNLDQIFKKARINLLEILNSEEKNVDVLRTKAKKCIEEFDEKLIHEKEKMVSILNCIDKQNGQLLATKYNIVQDKFLELIQRCVINVNSNNVNIDQEIFEMKSIIISCSYNIGLQFI